ncbi:putative outer membrane lipoprotein [Solibacillus kalamii]|uniref:Uncharacterized protein n=1 Tax=Solibacillus kalamii TaxID=1748298 RepID=A0ABX3ZMK8_9BACL|nr:hypothetical protein [Solibacillus kalamii]MBM7664646.1 putative outer membrane lipoprotein [Solibacillus kalamii]OUZ40975.1 hypothetical protein CBM15_03600 [Solibacillus kalamii]
MKTKKSFVVGIAMFQVIGGWALWFMGIVLAIYIGSAAFSDFTGNSFEMSVPAFMEEGSKTSIAAILGDSARIFFLVCGILSMGPFLQYFVSMGITRKAYFKGNVMGIFLLAAAFTVLTAILYGVEYFIFGNFDNSFEQMLLFFVKLALDIVVFYLIGWFIAAGFYRMNLFKGVSFILISLIAIFFQTGIWGEDLPLAIFSIVSIEDYAPVVIVLLSTILVGALVYTIRQLTKNMIVKA